MVSCVIWDWNGTLFDDRALVLESVAAALVEAGFPPRTPQEVAVQLARPLRAFFTNLAGRDLADAEWDRLEKAFHRFYRMHLDRGVLVPRAREALETWKADNRKQLLVSTWLHDDLIDIVAAQRLTDLFDLIRGRSAHESKTELVASTIDQLGLDPAQMVLIGDTRDDISAALHSGIGAILLPYASLQPVELADVADLPVQVAASALHAVQLAQSMTGTGDIPGRLVVQDRAEPQLITPKTNGKRPQGLLDADRLIRDFPILSRTMHNQRRLIYLDSGATSHKPAAVLAAERAFYTTHNAAVHRSAHQLAVEATEAYEQARTTVGSFVGAPAEEVVFVKSATEGINLIAYVLSCPPVSGTPTPWQLQEGDEVLVTEMEHHANLIPWQQSCARSGATLRWIGLTDDGRLDLTHLDTLITQRTKIVAITHQSNVLGTINPVELIAAAAHAVGALVVADVAQSVPHCPVNLRSLGADIAVFSGHKMCGPMGIGVLWGRREVLAELPPFLTGGSMIEQVTMASATFRPPPHRFETGVPPVAQAVGLAAACDYLTAVGMDAIAYHEHLLTDYALTRLMNVPGVTVIGPTDTHSRGGTVSFVVDGVHAHDVGQVLDEAGVAVRVGHHCARPVHHRYGASATTRASFYLYNTIEDIDTLMQGVCDAQRTLSRQ